MLLPALGLLLAAVPPDISRAISSFTLTCAAKSQAGLQAFGGIGAVAYAGKQRWWMASEGLPLIFPVRLDLRQAEFRPSIGQPLTIHADPRQEQFIKIEAIASCHNRLIVGTEAVKAEELKSGRDQDLRLVVLDTRGRYLEDLPLPNHYLRHAADADGPETGSAYYRGIQGLSCSRDGSTLLVSLQRPLRQDGDAAFSRQLLYRWDPKAQTFRHARELAVPLSLRLGMMDTELLGEGKALILENEVKPQQRNTLSLFNLDADDISACRSFINFQARPARKRLLVDHLERFAGVDLQANEVQYDAMALGPVLGDGRQTLLLTNDDDHCGTITSPNATIAPGFAGTTFTRIVLPPSRALPEP